MGASGTSGGRGDGAGLSPAGVRLGAVQQPRVDAGASALGVAGQCRGVGARPGGDVIPKLQAEFALLSSSSLARNRCPAGIPAELEPVAAPVRIKPRAGSGAIEAVAQAH